VTASPGPVPRTGTGPDTTTTPSVTRGSDDFAAGYRLGWETGYDIGVWHGAEEQSGAWASAVADAKELLRQAHEPDRPDRRVALAERYCAVRAERLYNDPAAWDSAWWSITFNCSPAEPYDVWQLAVAGRSELGTTTKLAEAN
jgi:hypothetical protein